MLRAPESIMEPSNTVHARQVSLPLPPYKKATKSRRANASDIILGMTLSMLSTWLAAYAIGHIVTTTG